MVTELVSVGVTTAVTARYSVGLQYRRANLIIGRSAVQTREGPPKIKRLRHIGVTAFLYMQQKFHSEITKSLILCGSSLLAALTGDKTFAELAAEFDVHPNQINDWRRQMLNNAATVFGRTNDHQKADEAHLKELHAKIGQLALENDFLSKALGR